MRMACSHPPKWHLVGAGDDKICVIHCDEVSSELATEMIGAVHVTPGAADSGKREAPQRWISCKCWQERDVQGTAFRP